MIVQIGGQEYELESVNAGTVPGCRLVRKDGPPITPEEFAALPAAHQAALMALIKERIGVVDRNRRRATR